MTARLSKESTVVPIAGGQEVEITSGDPWPAPYRGSKYSLVDSPRHNQTVLQWKYKDLVVVVDPPKRLPERLQELGKSAGSGKGSIRITAAGEILTKIHSSEYTNIDQAPVDTGWIPVYLGTLDGELGFDIDINPTLPESSVDIWSGFPFNHGERWAVTPDDTLIWKWKDYRFKSVFDHSELIDAYENFRTTTGRLYINEHGHVIVNVPQKDLPDAGSSELATVYDDWKNRVSREGDNTAQRLVSRRLKVTGDGDPSKGHLPLYIGHLSQFDDGLVPRPVVTDESYYVAAARQEGLNSY